MKVLIVDNYDSFTFNLFHLVDGLGAEVVVKRNDDINLNEIAQFDKIILSPGPGLPQESEGMMQLIRHWIDQRPFLGVCLGMQALAVHFGDDLMNLKEVKHGVQTIACQVNESKLLTNIDSNFKVGLYHSWAIECKTNSPLIVTSRSESGIIMSVEHKMLPVYGVQFHPESILTENGREILNNFLEI